MSRGREKLTSFSCVVNYHGYALTIVVQSARMSTNGQPGNKFRAVILDYGAVLCDLPRPREIEFMARVFQVAPAEFPKVYAFGRHAYDRGDLTTEEYWAALARQTGVSLAPDTFDRLCGVDKEMWSRANPEMIRWLATLRPAGYKTALLSNMQHDMVVHLRANSPWLSHFDHEVFSAEVRAVKPEPAIYQHCLELLNVEPGAALFVDDRDENVVAARALGIAALQFHSVAQLRRDLAAAGFRHVP